MRKRWRALDGAVEVGLRMTFSRPCHALVFLAWLLAALSRSAGATGKEDPDCNWTAPTPGAVHAVRTVPELVRAIREAVPGTTILVEDGEYSLPGTLEIRTRSLVVAGKSRDSSKVVIRGDGMEHGKVRVAIAVAAPEVTIADLTIRDVSSHGVQVRGEAGASAVTLLRLHIVDAGQQLVKGSVGNGPLYADNGLIACSTFEYTKTAPSSYTNGVDIIAGRGWVIRDNQFLRIRGPQSENWSAGPALLSWGASADIRIERNTFTDCFRGIALGLGPHATPLARDGEPVFDHRGGWIRKNRIVNHNDWADEGIEVNAARDVSIEDNVVDVQGRLPWSISVRFPMTTAIVRRNRTSRGIVRRDRAEAKLEDNLPFSARCPSIVEGQTAAEPTCSP